MARLTVKESTLKKLFALSGNQCAFPGCEQALVDQHGNLIADVCHIEAAEPGGERFNADQSDEDRRDIANLIVLCPTHHRLTDDVDEYPVDRLQVMKQTHEQQHEATPWSTTGELLQRLVRQLEQRTRPPGPNGPPRVFISYARVDGDEYAKELRARIERDEPEITLWRDREEMIGGRGWWKQIEEALQRVEYMVLVLTPGAVQSEITIREWRYARQQGVCVVPVQSPYAPIDFTALPKWMTKQHCYDLDQEWKKFTLHLLSPCQQTRVPFMADPLPEEYVERPEELGQLIERVLSDDRRNPVAITTALHGGGGFGKTTLATRLCHDDRIVTAFDDGILWVTLGENPNVLGTLIGLHAALTGERPTFSDVHDATLAITETLKFRDCLLVIDDVWNLSHAQPFLRAASGCARLITTRQFDIAIAARSVDPVLVDEMKPDEARRMLGRHEDDAFGEQLDALASRLGEWPLMLELARGAMRKRLARGESFAAAIDYVTRQLDRRGITGLDLRNVADRTASVSVTMELSLEHVDDDDRQACVELAVFAEDVEIPVSALCALWGEDAVEAEARSERLADGSLVRYSADSGTIRLHDVVRQYLGEQLAGAADVHGQLVDGWCDVYDLPDEFAWRWIGYHLVEAGRSDQLDGLLFDPRWQEARLAATHPNELIADCDRLLSRPEADDGGERVDRESLRLLRDAHRLSSYLTAVDPDQLAGQLAGRLNGAAGAHDRIAVLLDRIRATRVRPSLLPTNSVLNPAGGPLIRTLAGHTGVVADVCVTSDGRHAISASDDQTLKVWDVESGAELRTLEGHAGLVNSVCVTSDGRHAISASRDKTLTVWDVQSGEELRTLEGHTREVTGVCVTSDGRHAISASRDQTLKVWDVESGAELRTLEGHKGAVNSVCVTSDGRHAISASRDQTLKVWDVESGAELRTLEGHALPVRSVCVTSDGRHAISASSDETLKVWDVESGAELRTLEGHGGSVTSVCVTSDGRHAISASNDQTLKVSDVESGEKLRTLEGHALHVNSVCVAGDGRYAISASNDRTLKVWDLHSDEILRTIQRHGKYVTSVCVTSDGRHAISASRDMTLKVWDVESGEELRTLEGHAGSVTSVCVTSDGRHAISASYDQTLKVWDVESGAELRTLEGHEEGVTSVCVTSDGRHAISASNDRTLKLWDVESGKELRTLEGHGNTVNSVCLTLDGRHAISASEDGTLKVWDVESGEDLRTLKGHGGAVNSVCVTSDGRHAISASSDKTVKVWDVESGKELRTLEGHRLPVSSVCVTSDGRYAISASSDLTLKVWDVHTGRLLTTFTAEEYFVSCAVSPDGRSVIAGEYFGRMHFLQLTGTGDRESGAT